MYQQLFVSWIHPHLPTIHFQVILWASNSLVLIEIWHLKLWRNNHVGYQAQFRHVSKGIISSSLNGPQPFLYMLKPFLLKYCGRPPLLSQNARVGVVINTEAPPGAFGVGAPGNACPLVAYSGQGSKSARVW